MLWVVYASLCGMHTLIIEPLTTDAQSKSFMRSGSPLDNKQKNGVISKPVCVEAIKITTFLGWNYVKNALLGKYLHRLDELTFQWIQPTCYQNER